MSVPPTGPGLGPGTGARLFVLTALARLSLVWEHLWPRLLPLLATVGLFVALALLDLLPMLSFWLHVLVLLGFVAALGWCFRYLLRGRYGASRDAARHRIERDSHVEHRPLTALEDQPLGGEGGPAERALWAAHVARMREMIGRLRVGVPSPGMARRDPMALRAIVPLLLVIGVAAGARDAGARFERALLPSPTSEQAAGLALDIWVTPPAYTRVAPILLQGQDVHEQPIPEAGPIAVPVGSKLLAQMGRTEGEARLMIGKRTVPFAALDQDQPTDGRRVEAEVSGPDLSAKTLEVLLGENRLAAWPITVVPDNPPTVKFSAPPQDRGRGQLGVQYEAKDDYGLNRLKLVVRHEQGWPVPGGEAEAVTRLPLPSPGSAEGKGRSTRDFSDHPWAGERVKMTLVASDAAGQEGKSEEVTMQLPARTFKHPIARALIAARKKLNRPGPEAIAEAAGDLQVIGQQPRRFFDDTIVFLAISVTHARLRHDQEPDARAEVQRILWETALRLEDGEFAIADRDLRDIQERLEQALRDGASDQELERLMDELQRAMQKYMQALAEHLKRHGMTAPPNDPNSQMMETEDLQRMLDRARQLSQAGAREAARQMLSQLNQMLNQLRNGARLANPRNNMNRGRQMLRGLRDLSRRQQRLLDRTFRQNQQGQRPGQQGQQRQGQQGQRGQQQGMQGLAQNQQQLRRDLGRMMLQMDEMMGGIPQSLGRAERAMKGAAEALRQGNGERAARDQAEALSQLRSAADQMAEQMARQQPGGVGLGPTQQQGQMPGNRDPFGRRTREGQRGNIDGGDVKIPSERELLRAREIMQELRRRSGEQFRPRPEREYIDRLIRRF